MTQRDKKSRVVAKWGVGASPRQRASAQSVECATIFNQKQHDSASPPAIFTQSRSARLLFIPPNEKSPQRKTFCGRGRGEEKKTEALKGITLTEFQDCFEKRKTRSDRCIASNGQYFEGD